MKANFFVFLSSQIPTFVVTYNTLVILFYFYILSTINKNCYVIRELGMKRLKKTQECNYGENFIVPHKNERFKHFISLIFNKCSRSIFTCLNLCFINFSYIK